MDSILLLAFLAGCFDPPFEASRSALIPQLVGTTLYGYALALSAYVSNLGLLTGYVLGGGLSGGCGGIKALLPDASPDPPGRFSPGKRRCGRRPAEPEPTSDGAAQESVTQLA